MEDSESEKSVEVLYNLAPDVPSSSGEEAPISEWSSLEVVIKNENPKKKLYSEGSYCPGSGEICAKYITASNSSVLRHLYYNYPSISDPGIENALLLPEQPVNFPDDGQELYLHLCNEMNVCPVRIFYKNLVSSEIDLSYYGVNQQGVRAMAEALQYNKFVYRFNLTDNFLNDDACYHLGQMLVSNSTLTELILDGCRIGASGMLQLGENLRTNRGLEYLSIKNNELGETGGLHFVKQLYDGATITRVNLGRNDLSKDTALAFVEVWEWKNNLTHLDLSWNQFFHVPSTAKMLDQLALSTCLEELNLSFNSLQGERVANAIKNVLLIPTLTALDLSHNLLQKEAIDIIISSLLSARKLTSFDLSSNPMTPEDAYKVLQKMLKPRIKINKLMMKNVCVQKPFIELLTKVKKMKSRKDFVCEFDHVLQNWTVVGPDARELILKRAQYLGQTSKNKVDTALFFMSLAKEYARSIPTNELVDRAKADQVALDADLIEELSWVFPGPKTAKARTINLNLVREFIERLWPDKKLPPTPPPEPEPVVRT